jgi:hypothetical protein
MEATTKPLLWESQTLFKALETAKPLPKKHLETLIDIEIIGVCSISVPSRNY